MPERSAILAGIGLMLLAMLMFSLNDALGKWLVATYSVAQILLIRSLAAILMLTPFLLRSGIGMFRDAPQPGLQLLRVALATAETGLFYYAVRYLPLADAMTFYLAGPIYVTALSALLLKEHVGAYRWSAVLIGFVGVVIALDPTGASFGRGSLVALVGSILYALLMIVTRHLRATPSLVLTAGQAFGAIVVGAVGAPFAWASVAALDYLLLFLLGVISVFAILFVNQSLRLAPASVVVPYQYTIIVWAVIFGFVVFGEVPEPHTLIGAAIIVATGLFIFLRERSLNVKGSEKASIAER